MTAPVPGGYPGARFGTALEMLRNAKGTYNLAGNAEQVLYTASTVEVTQKTITVPGGTMGLNGILRITAQYSFSGAGGTRTVRIKFGGTTYLEFVHASTVLSARHQVQIHNRNDVASQVGNSTSQANWTSTTLAPVTSVHNTANDVNITLTMQNANSGDSSILESYTVELLMP